MKTNDIYKAKVVEVLEDGSLIMSFQGTLVRIVNRSAIAYSVNELVKLKVKKLRPLEFKLLPQSPSES